jgi:hypothetical protein
MKHYLLLANLLLFVFSGSRTEAQISYQKMDPVKFSQVEIEDGFWKQRIKTVTEVALPALIGQAEGNSAAIRNFEKVWQEVIDE